MRTRRRNALLVVVLCISLLGSLIPPAAPTTAQPGQSAFGVNSHIATRYGQYETLDTPIGVLADASPGWAREEFQWGLVTDKRRDSTYNWAMLDKVINDLHSRGIKIIGLLNDDPSLGPPRGAQLDGFVDFAEAAVRRYGDKVQHWEVWNEPENPLYWGGLPNVNEYTRMLIAVSQRIRSVDPNAKILSAGIVPTNFDFIRGIHAAGGWSAFDILALHPYVDPFTPETGQIGDGGDLSKVQMLNEQYGAKPIWATEYGWSTGVADRTPNAVNPDTQANYLIRGAALMRAAGVENVIWYKLKDENAGNNSYGLIAHGAGRTDMSPQKTAYSAFRTLNMQLANTGSASALTIGQAGVVMDFEQPREWQSFDTRRGTLTESTARAYAGNASGAFRYDFYDPNGNDFVGLNLVEPVAIPGSPAQLGIWVSGNGSGHELLVAIRDSQNEVLKFRLGVVGAGDNWRFVSAPINGTVEGWRCESGCGNLRLDFPAVITALLLEDNPDQEVGSGTFYIDNLTAMNSAQGVRFQQGNEVVDVLWAVQEGQDVVLPTNSATVQVADIFNNQSTRASSNNAVRLTLGSSPIFVRHNPRSLDAPPPPAQNPPPPAQNPPPPAQNPPPPPTQRGEPVSCIAPTPQSGERCFDETGYCISGRIREYWEQNGGLPVFGFPIGPQQPTTIEGKTIEAQWFQRNRLELHPEKARPYDVLLGRLGDDALTQQQRRWQDFPRSGTAQAGCRYFPETEQNVCGEILAAWRASGLELDGIAGKTEGENLALWGLPISPVQTEVIEGREYQVQWFERARFELHPENAPPFNVQFGLLGNQIRNCK